MPMLVKQLLGTAISLTLAATIVGVTPASAQDQDSGQDQEKLSAVRYKNWKFYYTMSDPSAGGWIDPAQTYTFTLIQNIKRDPFEQAVGPDQKTFMSFGGTLAAPSTAYIYDWNILPIGQQLALRHLESYETYPPMQAPPSYNLDQVMAEIQSQKQKVHTHGHPSD